MLGGKRTHKEGKGEASEVGLRPFVETPPPDLPAYRAAWREILRLVRRVLSEVDEREVKQLIDILIITKARGGKVLVVGSGRSGLVGRAFAIRLSHLGFSVYVLGDTIVPALQRGDVLFAISGSGRTASVVSAARAAKEVGAQVIAVTSYPESDLAKIADYTVVVRGRTKLASESNYNARQILGIRGELAPLGTLFEISALVFLDAVIAELMRVLRATEEDLRRRHATVE